jgi:hypothetical protein
MQQHLRRPEGRDHQGNASTASVSGRGGADRRQPSDLDDHSGAVKKDQTGPQSRADLLFQYKLHNG